MAGKIRIGVGGWTFAPWRGAFYPAGLAQKEELAWASRRLTALEINATYYSRQSPRSFARWAAETPQDFVFTVKGSRFCTNRRVLSEAGEGIAGFTAQGLAELGPKLGPILWQFTASKKFDREDFAGFLALLPARLGGLELRHCVEVRHESFADPAFFALCRERGVAICLSEDDRWPLIEEPVADFAYARLMKGSNAVETGYPPAELDRWASRFAAEARAGRDAFVFFIHGGKEKAPAAATALMARLG
ncbi:MAG: DUF72 domain-containing protein [Caulobacteraceae bacterium]